MGELHSLAYTSSSLGWDFHNLGVPNADTMSLVMDGKAPFCSPLDSDFSTGYLEDALLEFGDRTKRRRLLLYTNTTTESDHHSNSSKSYWNSNCPWGIMSESINELLSDEPTGTSISEEAANIIMRDPEDQAPEATDSSSSSYRDLASTKSINKETLFSIGSSGGSCDKKNKKVINTAGVVYPFAVVKPGGVEGDITLNDINERILMAPTRPVRHPVGDFACRPCVSPDGPGLSGKAVVALTRIQTQGRGTITIIRTKG